MTRVESQARNGLLLLLVVVAGYVDALSYLFLRVFPANMTGNTVLIGIAAVQLDGMHLRHSAVALAGFIAGVAIGVLIAGRRAPPAVWPRAVTLSLGIEAGVLAIFALAWRSTEVPELIGIAALAMGLQSAAISRLDVDGIGGTFITGTLTRLVARALTAVRPNVADTDHGGGLLALVWILYLAGAGLAAAMPHGATSLMLPAALLMSVTIAAFLRFR